MEIIKADVEHLNDLAPLFNGYRVFYKQESDVEAAKVFLLDRLTNQDSVVYMAYLNSKAVGFTQLYPLYSSVSMKPMYLLNDLFVDSKYRGKGIGETLINKAKQLCIDEKNKGMAIETGPDNPAQNLYRRMGFVDDVDLNLFWTNKS